MSRLLGAGTHKSSSSLLAVSFNQDASCLSVGTRKGYSIWNTEPHGRVFSKNVGPTGIVEMLFCTSLVALVGTGEQAPPGATTAAGATGRQGVASPRKVQVVNSNRQSTICELLFPSSVLGVKLNRKRLVVLLEEEIYIYDISNMKLLHTIETSPNPQGTSAPSLESSLCSVFSLSLSLSLCARASVRSSSDISRWVCYSDMRPVRQLQSLLSRLSLPCTEPDVPALGLIAGCTGCERAGRVQHARRHHDL